MSLQLTPEMSRRQPPKPLFHKLETDLSDTEISDLSPDAEAEKTATVERKVPQHEVVATAAAAAAVAAVAENKSEIGKWRNKI